MPNYASYLVHLRVFIVQEVYAKKSEYFEDFQSPVAAYDCDGIIARANKKFRDFLGIAKEDISNGKINFFDYLDKENTMVAGYAHNAFGGEEKVTLNYSRYIRAAQKIDFPNAIFFPMTRDGDDVKLAGILLDEK